MKLLLLGGLAYAAYLVFGGGGAASAEAAAPGSQIPLPPADPTWVFGRVPATPVLVQNGTMVALPDGRLVTPERYREIVYERVQAQRRTF